MSDLQDRPVEPRLVLRAYASALPLGLLSFAVGMVLIAGIALHWITGPDVVVAGLVMATFVAPLEIVAAVFAVLSRDVGAATALGLFSSSWIAVGLVHVTTPPASTSTAVGMFELAFALVLCAPAVVALPLRPLLGAMLTVSVLRAALGGIYQLADAPVWSTAEGVAALVLAAIAVYNGFAFLVEDVRQRPVLPTGRSATSARALDGDLGDQLARAPREAGVRQQL